jgi:hypothetical protein
MREIGDKVAILYDDKIVFCIITGILLPQQAAEIYEYYANLGGELSGYKLSSLGDASDYVHLVQTSLVTGNSRYLVGKGSNNRYPQRTLYPLLDESLGDYIFQLQQKVPLNA